MSGIYIYTGKIKSGKTTCLQKWAAVNNNIDGILAPIINGHRHLIRIKSGKTKTLELSGDGNGFELTKIGNYSFLTSVFEWGREELYKASLQNPEWLIIDEVGPLELKGEGLEPMVKNIINNNLLLKTKILLVIRDSILDTVVRHYGLEKKEFKYFNFENKF